MNMLHLIMTLSMLFSLSSCHSGKTETAITKIINIDSYLVDCQGVGPQQCMRYREDSSQDWMLFYDTISGFDYQPGYHYRLKIQVAPINTAPADAASLHYTLIKILNMEKAPLITQQKTINAVSYQELSRGFYKLITVDNTTIASSKARNQDPATAMCSKKEWARVMELTNAIAIEGIDRLEAPTQKRQFDGAPHAELRITTADTTYTCAFDGGAPPEEIKALVNQILSLGENTKND